MFFKPPATVMKGRTDSFKIFILIFTFLIYTSYHLSRKPISVVKTVLHENESDFSNCTGFHNCSWAPFENDNYKTLLGYLDYAFLLAYALGMFFSGHIAERVNLRYFLSAGMMLVGIFTALFGCARYWGIHELWYFIVVQIFSGLFQSTGWPSVVACMANWYGKGNRGFIMGVWNSHTSIGNILGTIIPAVFVDYNWGLSFIVPAGIIFGLGVLVFFFLVPHPRDLGLPDPNHVPDVLNSTTVQTSTAEMSSSFDVRPPSPVSSVSSEDMEEGINTAGEESESEVLIPKTDRGEDKAISFGKALCIPGVLEYAMCLFFAKLVSYTFLFWLPNYIFNTTSYGPEKASYLATVFDIGGIIGSTTAGFVSDRTGKSAVTCLIMFFCAAPSLFLYQHYGSYDFAVSVILLLISGAFVNGPYGLITTAVSADLGTHESIRGNAKALSTVTAIIDGTGSIGAAFGPFLTGLISQHGWPNVFYMLITADALAFLLLMRLGVKEILSTIRRRRLAQHPPYN